MTDQYDETVYTISVIAKDAPTGALVVVGSYALSDLSEISADYVAAVKNQIIAAINASDDLSLVSGLGGGSGGGAEAAVAATYGLEPSNNHVRFETKLIDTFVRRQQKNTDSNGNRTTTPLIDFYNPWTHYDRTGSWYGKYAEFQDWLNTDEEIATFERYSGFKLEDMPLYGSQNALMRADEPTINEDGSYNILREEWECVLDEPVKVIVEIQNVWDRDRQELRIKRDRQSGEPILDKDGNTQLIERTVFRKWWQQWEEEVAAAQAALSDDS